MDWTLPRVHHAPRVAETGALRQPGSRVSLPTGNVRS